MTTPSAGEPGEATTVPPTETNGQIGHQALEGSIWMIAATGGAKAMGFACQLALAAFLSRQDFGVFAIAVSLSAILGILRDGGLQMVLIGKGRLFDSFAGPVFWMMLTINVATGCMIAAIARPAAQSYHLPELAGVIMLFALSVPLCVLPSVLTLRLNATMQFRALGFVQLVSAVIRNGLMLYFAWAGYGASSFILPLLITNVTDTLLLWSLSRFSPWALKPNFRSWPELFASGRWVILGTFAIAAANNGAYFIIGKFMPSDVLGTYFFAYQLVMQLGILLAENFYAVLFAAFVRMGKDFPRIRSAVPRALNVVVLVGAAASLAIAAIFRPLELALWHGKWAAAAPAVYALAAVWPAVAAVSVLRALQSALGRFHQWGLVTLAGASVSVLGTVIGAYYAKSALGASIGYAVGALFGAALSAHFALAEIGMRATDSALSVLRPWLVMAGCALCAHALGSMTENVILDLLLTALSFTILAVIFLKAIANESYQLVAVSVQRIVRTRLFRQPVIPSEVL
jgi:PST family polysaccharide transporter